MINDKNRIYDGWLSLQGGVDAGRAPDTLDPTQSQSAINMTFRGGSATTRPGFRKLPETFRQYQIGNSDLSGQMWCYNTTMPDIIDPSKEVLAGEYASNKFGGVVAFVPDGHEPPTEFSYFTHQNEEYIYRNGILQCAQAFSPHHGEDCIMAMIGGRLFKIVPDIASARVSEVVISDDSSDHNLRNSQFRNLAYMVQADKWFVIQDGESRPIIFDNTIARRATITSDPNATEVPVGTIMAYGMGRLCVVVNDRDVAFGDLMGSHDLPDPADSLILFTERNFLAEGFDAAIPFAQGLVTGLVFFPQLDTSTGNGQLLAFAERGAASFFLSLDRTQWKTSEFQILSLLTTGLRGHRSIAVVNEDLWFRADDGVRSYRQSRSEPSGWAHIPLSTNVKQYLGNDADWMLKFASAMYFDNRVLMTTSPMPNQNRPIHYGVVVVDFDILSSFGANSNPAWEGEWQLSDDIRPVQVLTGTFKGVTRSFLFGMDNNGQNQLYELSRADTDDWDDQPINWELVSRAFDFQKLSQQSTPFTENELYGGDMWLREILE